MSNSNPYNIITAPGEVWIAPYGTAFPAIDATPSGGWTLLGSMGMEDYSTDGVTITFEQKFNEIESGGSTAIRKVSRTTESWTVKVDVMDTSLETLRRVMNNNAITSTAAGSGVAGTKAVDLYQGVDVGTCAVMVRTQSPYMGNNANQQFEMPNAYQSSSKSDVKYSKGDAAMVTVEFKSLADPNAASVSKRYGRILSQTAAAL